jgi:hypothetical protein
MTRVIHYRAEWNAEVEALIAEARVSENGLTHELANKLHEARLAVWDYERNDAARMAAIDVLVQDIASIDGQTDEREQREAVYRMVDAVDGCRGLHEQGISPVPALPAIYAAVQAWRDVNSRTAERRTPLVRAAREQAIHATDAAMARERHERSVTQ